MPPLAKTVEKKVPIAALRFAADVEIGAGGDGASTKPVRIMARSADPVDHWWWGRIVHDMSGMSLSKDRLSLDYCHDPSEILGFADKFDVSSGALVASGAMTPFKDGDRASEVLFKSAQGVPYEASIFFDQDSIVLESVPQGMAVEVNGKPFEGPGVVARHWTLRGIAICPHGQDKNTSVQFKANPGVEVPVKFMSDEAAEVIDEAVTDAVDAATAAIEEIVKETVETVTEAIEPQTEEATDTENKETESEEASADSTNELSKQGKRFLDAFGDQGGVWFAQGLSFEQAQAKFNQKLVDENKSLREQNAQLSTKLAASRGEKSPVSFQEGEPERNILPQHARNLTSGLAKFASSIKFKK